MKKITYSENIFTNKNILIGLFSLIITYFLHGNNKYKKRRKNKSAVNTFMKAFRLISEIITVSRTQSMASEVRENKGSITVEQAIPIEL